MSWPGLYAMQCSLAGLAEGELSAPENEPQVVSHGACPTNHEVSPTTNSAIKSRQESQRVHHI